MNADSLDPESQDPCKGDVNRAGKQRLLQLHLIEEFKGVKACSVLNSGEDKRDDEIGTMSLLHAGCVKGKLCDSTSVWRVLALSSVEAAKVMAKKLSLAQIMEMYGTTAVKTFDAREADKRFVELVNATKKRARSKGRSASKGSSSRRPSKKGAAAVHSSSDDDEDEEAADDAESSSADGDAEDDADADADAADAGDDSEEEEDDDTEDEDCKKLSKQIVATIAATPENVTGQVSAHGLYSNKEVDVPGSAWVYVSFMRMKNATGGMAPIAALVTGVPVGGHFVPVKLDSAYMPWLRALATALVTGPKMEEKLTWKEFKTCKFLAEEASSMARRKDVTPADLLHKATMVGIVSSFTIGLCDYLHQQIGVKVSGKASGGKRQKPKEAAPAAAAVPMAGAGSGAGAGTGHGHGMASVEEDPEFVKWKETAGSLQKLNADPVQRFLNNEFSTMFCATGTDGVRLLGEFKKHVAHNFAKGSAGGGGSSTSSVGSDASDTDFKALQSYCALKFSTLFKLVSTSVEPVNVWRRVETWEMNRELQKWKDAPAGGALLFTFKTGWGGGDASGGGGGASGGSRK